MKHKIIFSILLSGSILLADRALAEISRTITIDSLGACQGISRQGERYFLYGDREVGVMREYRLGNDTLINLHKEYRFTINGQNIVKHPTGIAYQPQPGLPTIVGNSVRMNAEGTLWNLHWDSKTGRLILVQNQIEGRKWKLSFLDLEKSIANEMAVVLNVVEPHPHDELEGFTYTADGKKRIAVSSSRKNNVSFLSF